MGKSQAWQWKLVLFFTDTVIADDRLSIGGGGHQEAQNTNKPWIPSWFSRCSFSARGRSAAPLPQLTTPILLQHSALRLSSTVMLNILPQINFSKDSGLKTKPSIAHFTVLFELTPRCL